VCRPPPPVVQERRERAAKARRNTRGFCAPSAPSRRGIMRDTPFEHFAAAHSDMEEVRDPRLLFHAKNLTIRAIVQRWGSVGGLGQCHGALQASFCPSTRPRFKAHNDHPLALQLEGAVDGEVGERRWSALLHALVEFALQGCGASRALHRDCIFAGRWPAGRQNSAQTFATIDDATAIRSADTGSDWTRWDRGGGDFRVANNGGGNFGPAPRHAPLPSSRPSAVRVRQTCLSGPDYISSNLLS
jgi:hypothetical protein